MVTASDIEGRLRIRDKHLQDPSVAETIRDALAAFSEIYETRVNTRAGSLLVLYDDSAGVRDRIMSSLGIHLQERKTEAALSGGGSRPARFTLPIPAVSKRKLTHIGLVSSLGLSLLGAAFDFKKLHVFSGILFVGVLGLHLSTKRRLLFT